MRDFVLALCFALTCGIALADQANILPQAQPISPNAAEILNLRTVAQLPPCNAQSKGYLYAVTDASSPTYGATLTGGSTSFAIAACDGANWTAH